MNKDLSEGERRKRVYCPFSDEIYEMIYEEAGQ